MVGIEGENAVVELSEGIPLRVRLTTDNPPTGRILVAVRPEHVSLKREAPETGMNALEGRIVDVTFLGPTLRFHVELGGAMIVVDTVGDCRSERYRLEERVYLELDPASCFLLPA
ncbi:MAG: TOBE domain-containing protein [Deltaproteobacteria bacterium]|nr:TOBE domain-containing protein [Deltaproteobacteria bacterium]